MSSIDLWSALCIDILSSFQGGDLLDVFVLAGGYGCARNTCLPKTHRRMIFRAFWKAPPRPLLVTHLRCFSKKKKKDLCKPDCAR